MVPLGFIFVHSKKVQLIFGVLFQIQATQVIKQHFVWTNQSQSTNLCVKCFTWGTLYLEDNLTRYFSYRSYYHRSYHKIIICALPQGFPPYQSIESIIKLYDELNLRFLSECFLFPLFTQLLESRNPFQINYSLHKENLHQRRRLHHPW